jgi:SAM-dependent methyltransferase
MLNSKSFAWLLLSCSCNAFMMPGLGFQSPMTREVASSRPQRVAPLQMGLDMVTYMRVEWIAAALVTNQTPRTADVVLQLGCEDGRAVTFVPRTVDKLITSTVEADGIMPVAIERQLRQQEKSRNSGGTSGKVEIVNQRADDLKETADESVDVVISLAACERMIENGLDWKKSVQEAARVLKPGGRLLFVEPPEIDGVSYLDYLANLSVQTLSEEGQESTEEPFPVFEPLGYDDVDLVLRPHVAGVVVKSEDAGLSKVEREMKGKNEEQDKYAEISIAAFERGLKKRKRKKKVAADNAEESSA